MPQMLRPPAIGPIVGHTTEGSVRVWMRGADVDGFRSVGVAGLFKGASYVKGSACYFRLHREYDRTGTVDFEKLVASTDYVVRMGSIVLDSTNDDAIVDDAEVYARLPKPEAWAPDLGRLPDGAAARVRTYPARNPAEALPAFSFLFGSCRYPGILMGKKRADEIFRAMVAQLDQSGALRPLFNLMIGDQIYADQLHRTIAIKRADTAAEFHDRYDEAFTSPYFGALTRQLPTYMMLDDHEIEDNWSRGRLAKSEKRSLFNHAIHAYLSYQWLHGPRNFGKRLYYSFECAGVPFFALDERTERIRDDDDDKALDDNHLLGYPAKNPALPRTGQLERLCDWLMQMQQERGNVPKFIVSPSVFVPNDVADVKKPHKSDSWPAFPNTRKAVLETIFRNNIQNVVFLCGDVHSSHVAEIEFEVGGEVLPLRALSITSSAFYWPFPFADGDERSFVHDSRAEGDGFELQPGVFMHYRARGFEQDDNFTRVDLDAVQRRLRVTTIGRKGQELTRNDLALA